MDARSAANSYFSCTLSGLINRILSGRSRRSTDAAGVSRLFAVAATKPQLIFPLLTSHRRRIRRRRRNMLVGMSWRGTRDAASPPPRGAPKPGYSGRPEDQPPIAISAARGGPAEALDAPV
jgi:hypothetical protein